MHHRTAVPRPSMRILASAAAVILTLASSVITYAEPEQQQPVTNWARQHAVPLSTVDPRAGLDDLLPLQQSIGDADIVGLGESVHGSAEEITLKHRMLRLLVEQMGFRSVAWEEDWTTGLQINEYLQTGNGDPDALVSQMSPQWQSREVADVLRWLRDFNAQHADKVQFVGVEYYLTGPRAYDLVENYVAAAAPQRLAEVRGHLSAIRPTTSTMFEYIGWYMGVADKSTYIQHAHAVYDLVNDVAHAPDDRAHALALHTARQIVSFYEHYDLSDHDALVYRDAHAAENVRWWREFSDDKIAYWAASPHTANAPQLRMVVPPDPDMSFPSAGSYLRQWYGQRYLSIGFIFDHGAVSLEPGKSATLPAPAQNWFEQPFGAVGLDPFALDLRAHAPEPVRRWLDAPIVTRGLADRGPDAYMTGGTLAQWYDVIIHRQVLTPFAATASQ